MPIVVQINNVNQTIPTQGDEGWGNYTTTTLIALAQAVFPKGGGNFFLTGNVNLGPNFALQGIFESLSSPVASQGTLRLGKTDTIDFRNNANTGDISIGINGSDEVVINGNIIPAAGNPSATYGVNLTGSPGTNDANFIRSDAVLTLDQGISPEWTGSHSFDQQVHVYNDMTVQNRLFCGSLDATSDENLKTNINVIESPLEKIFELNGVTFDWKSDGSKSVGLIAQEVEKIFPELVNATNGVKHLNYLGIIGLLVESIKELHTEIELIKRGL